MNELKKLTVPILEWYRNNARDLPWRRTDDPYRIWVSEIMLQQTRVAAVLGYYNRFLTAFPTVTELAAASEEQLLKLWEGLGYYSRARNLQKAAQLIVHQHDGRFPMDYDSLLRLPGIGEYTAGAIASAAYGAAVPAVDGNVLRVISRITESYDDITDNRVKKKYRIILEEMLPPPGDDMKCFNQAMMELGATVCLPNGEPKCDICPVREHCKAFVAGTAMQLPVKRTKKARRIQDKTVFLMVCDGAVALRKRLKAGLLAGLWEYPNVDGILSEAEVADAVAEFGLRIADWKQKITAKHIFTHVEWHMVGYVLEVVEPNEAFTWADASTFDEYAIPSAFARFTEQVNQIIKA